MKRCPRRVLFQIGALVFLALVLQSAGAPLSGTGPVVPELAALEQAMTNYMTSHGFEAGSLALMKDSKLVFRSGFGWRNSNRTAITHPDSLFRLASVSKTITGSAIRKLVNAGQLSTSTPVYSYLGIPPWNGTLGDARITNITVQHLLDHRGGWTGGGSGSEAVFQTVSISTAMGLTNPAAASNIISWMWAQPLNFTPGTQEAYSNFGYQILGRVIERASGKSYINYLKEDMFGPFGVTNIIQSRSRPGELDPWEVWYAGTVTTRSAVDYPTNIQVRYVDGGHYFESYDAFGGLTASAGDLCRYMLRYWVGGVQRVPGSFYGWSYLYYGSLDGTTSVIHQNISQNSSSTNGLEFAVLFNERTGGNDNEQANAAIAGAAASITSWPQNGGGRIEWDIATTNVYEHASNVVVRLVRTGLTDRPVKVSYTTYSRSAGTNSYLPASGVVLFAADETSKDVPITIYDEDTIFADREFSVELISASGGAWLGDRVTCVVRILNNDIPPTLTITKITPAEALLQWPTNYTGFRPNYALNLRAPILWRILTNPVTTNGGLYNVSVSTTNPVQFFRLRRP